LSGAQNKSQRNRIVPIPDYIRKELLSLRLFDPKSNIFTGQPYAFNYDYFKVLWTRFKRTNNLIQNGQTIYSFRHSGAIEVFTRTNNLHLLSKLMGHSSVSVTLTYLRGLEIACFEASDLPQLKMKGTNIAHLSASLNDY
jgi:integrase